MFVFVRQDLPIAQQLVQSSHASLTLAQRVQIEGIPNLVLVGVPSQKHLLRVERKLIDHAVDHVAWEEPDYDFGLTALATAPLTDEQKGPFAHYRLWQPICLCSLEIRANGSNRETLANNQAEAPYSPVAQRERHAAHKAASEMDGRTIPGEPILN